jgi:hypothetical protein
VRRVGVLKCVIMKTKLEWRHGAKVLKIDDTSYDQFPEEGDVIEMEEAGQTHRFRVAEIESAVVVLETVDDTTDVTPVRPMREAARTRVAERLDAERSVRSAQGEQKTFRVSRAPRTSKPASQRSRPLSKTARTRSGSSTAKARK